MHPIKVNFNITIVISLKSSKIHRRQLVDYNLLDESLKTIDVSMHGEITLRAYEERSPLVKIFHLVGIHCLQVAPHKVGKLHGRSGFEDALVDVTKHPRGDCKVNLRVGGIRGIDEDKSIISQARKKVM